MKDEAFATAGIVIKMIKLNVVVFILWYLLFMMDPLLMPRHFLASWEALAEGRWWTLITSVFSHQLFFHLLINMYFLYGFGVEVEKNIGSRSFLLLYLMSGIVGSMSHCLISHFLMGQSGLNALGASGAISGVLIYFALSFPWRPVYLLGLIPLPAFVGILMFVVMDVWGLIAQINGSLAPIGFGAHLGGSLFGGFFFLVRKYELARLNRQNIA